MTVKQRYQGIQDILLDCHEGGCHFLTLLSIAEEERERMELAVTKIDLIEAIKISQSKGWLKSDFTVMNATEILKHFTNKKWIRSELLPKLPSKIKDNEYSEVVYHNDRTKFDHFRRRGFDTLWNSVTVKEGYISGYYIYTCEE